MSITRFSDDDLDILRQMADWFRRRRPTPSRSRVPEIEQDSPDVYVALTPEDGIWPLSGEFSTGTGTGTGTAIGQGNSPGYADCDIYRVEYNEETPNLINAGFTRRIHNLGENLIPGDVWVLVIRDKWGEWYAVEAGASDEVPHFYVALTPEDGIWPLTEEFSTGTGTFVGTGTGTDVGIGEGNSPGYADCNIYRIDYNEQTPNLVSAGFTKRVHNLCTDLIPGDIWIVIGKDPWGHWYAIQPCPTQGASTLTVEDDDGVPSFDNINTIQFDQTDGFVLTTPSDGIVKVDLVIGSSATVYRAVCTDGDLYSQSSTVTISNGNIVQSAWSSPGTLLDCASGFDCTPCEPITFQEFGWEAITVGCISIRERTITISYDAETCCLVKTEGTWSPIIQIDSAKVACAVE